MKYLKIFGIVLVALLFAANIILGFCIETISPLAFACGWVTAFFFFLANVKLHSEINDFWKEYTDLASDLYDKLHTIHELEAKIKEQEEQITELNSKIIYKQ